LQESASSPKNGIEHRAPAVGQIVGIPELFLFPSSTRPQANQPAVVVVSLA